MIVNLIYITAAMWILTACSYIADHRKKEPLFMTAADVAVVSLTMLRLATCCLHWIVRRVTPEYFLYRCVSAAFIVLIFAGAGSWNIFRFVRWLYRELRQICGGSRLL